MFPFALAFALFACTNIGYFLCISDEDVYKELGWIHRLYLWIRALVSKGNSIAHNSQQQSNGNGNCDNVDFTKQNPRLQFQNSSKFSKKYNRNSGNELNETVTNPMSKLDTGSVELNEFSL